MIIKILGILDILMGFFFWIFMIFNVEKLSVLVLLLGLFLLVKGLVFMMSFNITSILDIISSLVIIASSSIEIPNIIVVIISLFLIQKGVFSLLG